MQLVGGYGCYKSSYYILWKDTTTKINRVTFKGMAFQNHNQAYFFVINWHYVAETEKETSGAIPCIVL